MSFGNGFGRAAGGADGQSSWLTSFMALSSVFAGLGMISQAYLGSSVKLLILGSVVEMGRRLCQWLMVRLRFQYSLTAQFDEGDPAYEWLLLFLTQENVWARSREFRVNATNSRRKWSVKMWIDPTIKGNAEYVPTYQLPQLFRWRGNWLEIKRSQDGASARFTSAGTIQPIASIYVTIYTLDMNQLSDLVEDARKRYVEVNRPNVIIHLADSVPTLRPRMTWNNVKHKVRRPLSSIILEEGVVDALVRDAREFIATEDWYVEAGIPHRCGNLLHGPPGTGKTSTIYALAGALNLEIYSLSLAAGFVDDAFLQRAASSIPKHALFLIEDIDCAFASRDDEDDAALMYGLGPGAMGGMGMGGDAVRPGGRGTRSLVTLSGLLNVIDGVGSEEGKLFFATTNYIDRLDPALLRPGGIDRKVAYELATAHQAEALFLRFFPEARFPDLAAKPLPQLTENSDIVADDAKMEHTPAFASDSEPTAQESKPQVPESKPDVPASNSDLVHVTLESTTANGVNTDGPPRSIPALADAFAAAIPAGEFSTAELQCYLQAYKKTPAAAVAGAHVWIEEQRAERRARETREEGRKLRARERREVLLQQRMGGPAGANASLGSGLSSKGQEEGKRNEGTDSPAQKSDSEFSVYADGGLPADEEGAAVAVE